MRSPNRRLTGKEERMHYAKLWNVTIVCTIVAALTLMFSLGHGLTSDAQADRIVAKRGPTGRIIVVHHHPHPVQH